MLNQASVFAIVSCFHHSSVFMSKARAYPIRAYSKPFKYQTIFFSSELESKVCKTCPLLLPMSWSFPTSVQLEHFHHGCCYKTFIIVKYVEPSSSVCAVVSHFHPSLTFAGKARAHPIRGCTLRASQPSKNQTIFFSSEQEIKVCKMCSHLLTMSWGFSTSVQLKHFCHGPCYKTFLVVTLTFVGPIQNI